MGTRTFCKPGGGVLSSVPSAAVVAGVSSLLDHSAECPIRDLKDVEYREGRLVFTAQNGGRVYNSVHVNDEDVMSGFSESDARLFVREFRRLKARER